MPSSLQTQVAGTGAAAAVLALRAASMEARAFARVAALVLRDRTPCLPALARSGDDVVVLVHGSLASAGVMRPLREHLESACGVHSASFTYGPMVGVEAIARSLDDLIQRLPPGVRVHLVGHSLGGLAVRWYAQEVGAHPSVVETVSVAAPFAGARGAFLMPGPAGRDMCAGSAVLTRLRENAAAAAPLPHLSVFGSADTAVPASTSFPTGDRVVVEGCGHNGLLFHPRVLALVAERVLAFRTAANDLEAPR